ncbi:DUF4012 domain-containing protein [Candidatus Gracilibacteria bacterium]|nr:DUF4012 domain-containing protein [Candidatus Gracilibacteria bacterium]
MSEKSKKDSEEIKKIEILNDIEKTDEENNIDISSIFLLQKTKVLKSIFKKNTLDLKTDLKKYVFCSIYPKIKLLKLYRPINIDIKKIKKHKPLILSYYLPKKDETTLDFLEVNNNKEYFDIIKPTKKIFDFKKLKNLRFPFLKALFSLIFLFIFLAGYGIGIKFYIENTFLKLSNIDFKNTNNLVKEIPLVSSDLKNINILILPIKGLNLIINNDSINNLSNIINGTLSIINTANSGVKIYVGLDEIVKNKGIENIMFSQFIENITPILSSMKQNLEIGVNDFSKVKSFSSKELDEKLNKYKNILSQIKLNFDKIYLNLDVIKDILGHNEKKTYFVIFQNNDEIRPTGGFMGSVGIIEVFRGQVIKFENKDIYAIEWDLKDFASKSGVAFEEISPKGLNKITPTFGLRDANYFPDIKESSLKIKSFLDKSPKYKIDGIVYINQNIIKDILKLTGPIYFDDLKKEINDENFSLIFSTLVEAKLTKTHTLSTPKQILFDFSKIFLDKLKKDKDYKKYLDLAFESIDKKDIIFYLFDEKNNDFLTSLGLEKKYDYSNYLDFNYPVFTSISGNKSDRYMKRDFVKDVNIGNDCSINTTFTINQRHNFTLNDEVLVKTLLYENNLTNKVDVSNILDIQGRGLNKQFVRVLIPKDAIIQDSGKYFVENKPNYKEVSFYLETFPSLNSSFSFNYSILNNSCKNYNYLLQKQPGISNYGLEFRKNGILENSLYNENDFIYNN